MLHTVLFSMGGALCRCVQVGKKNGHDTSIPSGLLQSMLDASPLEMHLMVPNHLKISKSPELS